MHRRRFHTNHTMLGRTTAIELGPDSCLLAGVRPRAGVSDVFAVHAIRPDEWPDHDDDLSTALRTARRHNHLPRRITVVDWGLAEAAAATNPMVRAALQPIRNAGFRIAEVLSPTDALARLAATHQRRLQPGANAWVALNTHGGAIAIVRRNAVLFSRVFNWSFTPRRRGSASHLLQRYSLVAHLVPELQRGLAQVRATDVKVNAVVTCGNLPDLRSFTMPLTQELDLEVEALDSTAGLRPKGRATSLPFAEMTPALRLACAAVGRAPTSTTPATVSDSVAILVPLVGAAAVGLAFAGYAFLTQGVKPAPRSLLRASVASPAPAVLPPPQTPPLQPSAGGGQVSPVAPDALAEPLPRVDSILIDQDRRVALIHGAIVEPGYRVGSRTVVRIGQDFVVLREPSGRTVTVTLREGLGQQP